MSLQSEGRSRRIRSDVEQLDRLARRGDADAAQEFLGKHLSDNVCQSCHDVTLESGSTFRRSIGRSIRSDPSPKGLLELGFDLSPAWGDHDGWSASIAKAFRATLYSMRELDDDL